MRRIFHLPDCIVALFTVIFFVAILGLMLFEPEVVNHAAGAPTPDGQLLIAASEHDVRAVEQALAAGADIESASPSGITPLCMSCSMGDAAIVRTLLDHGAAPDHTPANRLSPLHFATVFDHADVVRLLLERGANCNLRYEKHTPLDSAEEFDRPQIAEILRAHGAKHANELDAAAAAAPLAQGSR